MKFLNISQFMYSHLIFRQNLMNISTLVFLEHQKYIIKHDEEVVHFHKTITYPKYNHYLARRNTKVAYVYNHSPKQNGNVRSIPEKHFNLNGQGTKMK